MELCQSCDRESVTDLAGRILTAWKDGEAVALQEELHRAANVPVSDLDSFEMERLELLEGIVQSLAAEAAPRDSRECQVRAALHLLEHLAGQTPNQF